MAIQVRRGNYADFDPDKMLPGEWACVLANDPQVSDGKSVFICFSAGNVKRMATYEDMVSQFGDLTDDIVNQLTSQVNAVIVVANEAAENANDVAEDLIARRDAGEFDGPPGKDGVVNVIDGQFAFQIVGDNLHLYYEGDEAPNFEINEAGHLTLEITGE